MPLQGGLHAPVAKHDHRAAHHLQACRLVGQFGRVHLGARRHRLGTRIVGVVDTTHLVERVMAHPQDDRSVLLGLPVVEGENGQVLPGQEGSVVPLHAAVAATLGPGGQVAGRVQVRHVKQGDLGAGGPALVGGLLADAQNPIGADGVQVAAEPSDLQLAPHGGRRGVREVHGVERIGLAKGHHVGHVAHVAHGEDPLAPAHVTHLAHYLQGRVVAGQHGHHRLGVLVEPPRAAGGGGHPQVTVVLGQRELVQEVARDLTRGCVGGGRRVGDVKLVDGGVPVVVPPPHPGLVFHLLGIDPGVSRHVQVLVPGVDGGSLSQHGGGRRSGQRLVEGHG